MAALKPQHTYSVEHVNLTRLSCIHQRVTTKVLKYIFQNGSSDRPHNMSLLDYYSSKGINSNRFRNRLFEEQRTKFDLDFQGDTFDITLLYKCLRCGSHGLAQENDEKWNRGDKASIESLITIVKNRRNTLAHDQPNYTKLQLLNEAQNLKDELKEILRFSEHTFHIPTATINQEISDVEKDVTKYLFDEFQPVTFEEYKNQLFFDAQSEYLKDEGVKDTMGQYDKGMENEVTPKNHVVDLNLPLNNVYTEMMMKRKSQSGQDKPTMYENVLEYDSKKGNGCVIVVSGPAGVGKTTFTKQMILEFKFNINAMKYLLNHDHLLKADCRDTIIKSFNELLHQLMPNVSKDFKPGDLEKVILSQKLLVILDGLDELNKASSHLFEELLNLTKKYRITLVVTTRPEKVNEIEQKLKSHNLKMKLIELLGVPTAKRDELVKKYHLEISKIYAGRQDISELLKYLKETELRLEELWRLPYNLVLLTIIWSYDFKDLRSINTAPELYREILQLHRTRLKERLQSNESTRYLSESQKDKIIDFFLYSLARESFIGLMNDHINLTEESYKRLEKTCGYLKIPTEEMISAFLKRIPGTDIIYGFAHKGIQDYLAAYYIWIEITQRDHNHDIQDILEGETEFLLLKDVSPIVIENTISFLRKELKKKPSKKGKVVSTVSGTFGHMFRGLKASSFIHKLLKDIHGNSMYYLPKFQNMFICLLGMFYSEKDVVDKDIKLEALMLLQGTGIRDRDGWITILNSVRCDQYVASFISKQPQILEGQIQITDSSVSAYVSLMKALKSPLKNAHKVKVDVNVKGELTDAHELLQLISFHKFKVLNILINGNNSQEYVAMLKDLTSPLKDAKEIKVIMKDIELLNSIELINLIEQNNFTAQTLHFRDFEIGDANIKEYVSVFKSLPRILKIADRMGVDINVKGDLMDSKQLLTNVMSNNQFRVKSVLMNKSNFSKYVAIMETLITPLNDASDVKIDICDIENLADIKTLMTLIKEKDFTIRQLLVNDFEINDSNFREYIPVFKSLPRLQENANQTCVDIDIKGDLTGAEDILELITFLQFKVKCILINDSNFMTYTTMLKNLANPFRDAHEVKVDICINENITTITELLREIKRKDFIIEKFKVRDNQITDDNFKDYTALLKEMPKPLKDVTKNMLLDHFKEKGFKISTLQQTDKTMTIDEDNIIVYTEALRVLPTLPGEDDRGKINLVIGEETSDVNTLLKEIARNMFTVFISLDHDFRHPNSLTAATEEAINNVFERCPILRYTGRITSQLSIASSIKHLEVSVPDTPSYLPLQRFLDTNHELTSLKVSLNLQIEVEKLLPLPGKGLKLFLFLPDVETREGCQKAAMVAKQLNPVNGDQKFFSIQFPRMQLKEEEITYLISQMKGVSIRLYLVFPTSCRSSSRDFNQKLEELAKRTLNCHEIYWGKPPGVKPGDLLNVDSWW